MQTESREDYLRALYVLDEADARIKSSEVASYLGVSKPSVSEMVKSLNREGLIHSSPYSKITFTPKGKKMAKRLTSKHRLIELFLKDMLHIKKSKIHEEANRLEHAFSDESIKRLRKLLRDPKLDPHGKPIPY